MASPGTVVLVAGGDYPSQTIGGDAGRGELAGGPVAASARAVHATGGPVRAATQGRVTFRPAPGASVRFAGTIYVFGSHVTIERMAVRDVIVGNYDQTPGRPNPTDVGLMHLRGRNFQIDSATYVTVHGGSWGPASACGGPYGGTNNSIRDITGVVPAHIVIDSVAIHDVQSYDLTNCHIEGLAIFAGRDVRVSRSRFYGNSVYDVFVQANSGPISDVRFIKNWMAMPVGTDGVENGTVIGFSAITSGVLIEDNRFNYIISLDDNGLSPVYSDFRLIGNVGVLPYDGCSLRGIVWRANLWRNGACSRSDVSMHGRPLPYRDRANGGALDYRLTRATPARWRARVEREPLGEREVEQRLLARDPRVLADERLPCRLLGAAARQRAAHGAGIVPAGLDERDVLVDLAHRLQVGRDDRQAAGEVLVQLQRAHRARQRRAQVRDQADVGRADQPADPVAGDRRVNADVGRVAQRGEVLAVEQRPDERDLRGGQLARERQQRVDVQARVQRADVYEQGSARLRCPGRRRRRRAAPLLRVQAVGHHRTGTGRPETLQRRRGHRARAAHARAAAQSSPRTPATSARAAHRRASRHGRST